MTTFFHPSTVEVSPCTSQHELLHWLRSGYPCWHQQGRWWLRLRHAMGHAMLMQVPARFMRQALIMPDIQLTGRVLRSTNPKEKADVLRLHQEV